jgi:hypothetical protein
MPPRVRVGSAAPPPASSSTTAMRPRSTVDIYLKRRSLRASEVGRRVLFIRLCAALRLALARRGCPSRPVACEPSGVATIPGGFAFRAPNRRYAARGNTGQPTMNRKLLSTLHEQLAALIALRDRARPEQRWMHDEEIERLRARLRDVRALAVTPEDEVHEKLRAGCGDGRPRDLRDAARAAPRSRRRDRRLPAGRPRRRATRIRAGPSSDDPDLDDPEASARGRAVSAPAAPVRPARPPWTLLGLLGRASDFWGGGEGVAFVRNGRDPTVWHVACPACKSKSARRPSERYCLDVGEGPRATWILSVRCRCLPEHVYAALGWRPEECA